MSPKQQPADLDDTTAPEGLAKLNTGDRLNQDNVNSGDGGRGGGRDDEAE